MVTTLARVNAQTQLSKNSIPYSCRYVLIQIDYLAYIIQISVRICKDPSKSVRFVTEKLIKLMGVQLMKLETKTGGYNAVFTPINALYVECTVLRKWPHY
jgi:hypothetical protein